MWLPDVSPKDSNTAEWEIMTKLTEKSDDTNTTRINPGDARKPVVCTIVQTQKSQKGERSLNTDFEQCSGRDSRNVPGLSAQSCPPVRAALLPRAGFLCAPAGMHQSLKQTCAVAGGMTLHPDALKTKPVYLFRYTSVDTASHNISLNVLFSMQVAAPVETISHANPRENSISTWILAWIQSISMFLTHLNEYQPQIKMENVYIS